MMIWKLIKKNTKKENERINPYLCNKKKTNISRIIYIYNYFKKEKKKKDVNEFVPSFFFFFFGFKKLFNIYNLLNYLNNSS